MKTNGDQVELPRASCTKIVGETSTDKIKLKFEQKRDTESLF